MNRTFQRPYVWWTLLIFITYLLLNVVLSNFTTTLQSIPYYLDTINWPLLLGSLFLSFVIAVLVAVTIVFAYIRHQERKLAVACTASVAGLIVGVCPLCTASVLPLVLGALGITFAWTMLPFQGVEVQIALIIFLSINLGVLRK